VPGSNRIRYEKHNKAIAASKQSYKYMLVGFAEYFSDMAQNITSVTYKGVGGKLRLHFRHNGTSCAITWPPNYTTR